MMFRFVSVLDEKIAFFFKQNNNFRETAYVFDLQLLNLLIHIVITALQKEKCLVLDCLMTGKKMRTCVYFKCTIVVKTSYAVPTWTTGCQH